MNAALFWDVVDTQTLGGRIRYYRKKASMSRVQLAGLIGVTADSIGFWERDEKGPRFLHGLELARVLGIDPRSLFPGNPLE